MRLAKGKFAGTVLAFAALFSGIAAFAFFRASEAHAAALPDGYYAAEGVGADGDWYFGAEYLDIAAAREAAQKVVAALGDDVEPVVIAVVDTGADLSHEIFGSVEGGTDVILRDMNGAPVSYEAFDGGSDVSDGATKDHHGTHVTGIVALLIRALGLEDYIKIMPVKAGKYKISGVSAGNYFYTKEVRKAIGFALENGADVVNLSLGISESSSGSEDWKSLVPDEYASQAVFVAAAGNYFNDSDDDPFYPAACANVVGVMNYREGENGAVLYRNDSGGGSNYGTLYDVCAPGGYIVSADGGRDNGYKTLSGTSMASPMASVGVALTALNAASQGLDPDGDELKELFLLTFRKAMYYGGEYYPELSLTGALEAEFETDADGNHYLATAGSEELTASPEVLTLGRDRELSLSVVSDWLDTGAQYEWSFSVNGVTSKLYGMRVSAVADVYTKEDIEVTLSVRAPNGDLLYRHDRVVGTEYLVPKPGEVKLTHSLRAEEDGSVTLPEGVELVVGTDVLRFASPDSVIVWYVNGVKAGSGAYLYFRPDCGGTYTVRLKVNGTDMGVKLVVNAEGEVQDPGLTEGEIAGIALGSAAGAALIVCLVVWVTKRKRARAE